MTFERLVDTLISSHLRGEITRRGLTEALLSEMGRRARVLVIDESVNELGALLAGRGYETRPVDVLEDDRRVTLQRLWGKILVTRNGRGFADPKTLSLHRYGLIWIDADIDSSLVDRIETVLRTSGFGENLQQVVKVKARRSVETKPKIRGHL